MHVESAWIDDAKDFFIKHYAEIIAPQILWRYGLGPRLSNMDHNVLTVDDLGTLNVLVSSEPNDPKIKVAEVAKKWVKGPSVKKGSEEVGVEEGTLQRNNFKQSASSFAGGVAFNVAPLGQVPLAPKSRFSLLNAFHMAFISFF